MSNHAQKNGDVPIPLLSEEDLNSSKQLKAGGIAASGAYKMVQRITLYCPLIATDVFAFSKQKAMQLLFILENLPFSFSTAREARVQS